MPQIGMRAFAGIAAVTAWLTLLPALSAATDPASTHQSSSRKTSNEVVLIKKDGVFYVPVEIDGVLSVRMILDTGASDLRLSPDAVLTLLKRGMIADKDWLPGKYYRQANGSRVKSQRLLLKSVRLGSRLFTNIACSISTSMQAPMLLGQNVLERLGKYTIDHRKSVLIFE